VGALVEQQIVESLALVDQTISEETMTERTPEEKCDFNPAYLEPSDIAALALCLASDESRYINGAIIPADGGWAAV
jgi:NAD(P)-dependent dehydrogenase (short-subunit alcohol dehydrogenase family)